MTYEIIHINTSNWFNKKNKGNTMEQKVLFQQNGIGTTGHSHAKSLFRHKLMPFTKFNSKKWITDLKQNYKTSRRQNKRKSIWSWV